MKEEIKNKLIELQKKMIAEFEEKVQDVHSMVDIDEEDTHDPEDFSHQYEAGEMEQLVKSQLYRAKEKLNDLKNMSIEPSSIVESGAIVETDKRNFVIGFSSTPFEIDEKEFVGISKGAPVYAAMDGKKVGDSFEVGGTNYTIKNIY